MSPLAELGIYNLKTLTALLGPVTEVFAAFHTAVDHRQDPDVEHVVIRHVSGTLSSLVSSHAVQGYRCPGLELYGTDGTVSLIGDDWNPRGVELLTAADGGPRGPGARRRHRARPSSARRARGGGRRGP